MFGCFLTLNNLSVYKTSQQEFEDFCANLDFLVDNINNELPIVSVISGNFNARCSKWCNKGITHLVGREINSLSSAAGYKQLISKPTHIVNNSSSCTSILFFVTVRI